MGDYRRTAGVTPVRKLALEEEDGCKVLTRGRVSYSDGAESDVAEIVQAAVDRSSLSDELALASHQWAQRYHLGLERPNFLRALRLPPASRVLEVGAGCGAVTRYLAETTAVVDAVEPVASRAAIARLRTHDAGDVEVFIGGVEDLPSSPAYDLVVICGVLEYVGSGSASEDPYVTWLRLIHSLLMPGGTIVCAIENQLGVKYLAGEPEDHTGRPFDGIEGYPSGGTARTFSRVKLAALLESAGFLELKFLHCFPDYKFTRAVLTDEALEEYPELGLALPEFPSPETGARRPKLADERSLWATLLAAGMGPTCSNSFMVLGRKDGDASSAGVWPEDQVAVYFSTSRSAAFSTRTAAHRTAEGLEFSRSRLRSGPREISSGWLLHRIDSSTFISSLTPLTDVVACSPDIASGHLNRWLSIVRSGSSPAAIDLIPRNVMVGPDGSLNVIDQEWFSPSWTLEDVVHRGMLLLAVDLLATTPPVRWRGENGREVLDELCDGVDVDPPARWLDAAVEREAAFQAAVRRVSDQAFNDQTVSALTWVLSRPLREGPLGDRLPDELEGLQGVVRQLEAELALVRRLMPPGSRRRRSARAVVSVLRRVVGSLQGGAAMLPREVEADHASPGPTGRC